MPKITQPKTAAAALEEFIQKVADLQPENYGDAPTLESTTITQDTETTGGAGGGSVVCVTENDTTADFLDEKIVSGTGIKTTVLSPGGDEELEIGVEIDSGVAFPGTPEDWQLFYRTDENILYLYDTSTWQEIGAGVDVVSGSADGQIPYWDSTTGKYVPSDEKYLAWDSTAGVKTLRVGDNGTANTPLVATYVCQLYGNASINGTIGTLDAGGLALLKYINASPSVTYVAADRAATTAKIDIDSQAVNSGVTLDAIACQFNLVNINESGSGSSINYDKAYAAKDYFQLTGGGYTTKYDRLWSGASRDNYCGEIPISQNVGAPDGWGVSFTDALPDTKYAIVVMGRSITATPTTNPLIPLVNIYVSCHGGQVGWKTGAAAGAQVHYTVVDTTTSLGADSILGPGMSVFDNFGVLAGAVGLINPTLTANGLDVADYIVRRYF